MVRYRGPSMDDIDILVGHLTWLEWAFFFIFFTGSPSTYSIYNICCNLYFYRQSLHQAKEKIRDLEKDNVILRWNLYCLTRTDLVDDDVYFAGRAMKNSWILLLTWNENENTWWGKKHNKPRTERSMVVFSGDRERTQSANLSTGDDFEVRPQRQEPFDWSSR